MGEAKRLYGLKAVVLAGATGISEAISRLLARHGASVLALDTSGSGVENTYRSVRGAKGLRLDPKAENIGSAVIDAAMNELGRVDIVINYLEFPQDGLVGDGNREALERLLHARSVLFQSVADATLPYLCKSPAGRFVSIGFLRSVFALDGENSFAEACKNLAAFTRKIARDNGPYGVSANYIQPGAIMTPECRKVYSMNKDLRDYCIDRSATGRLGETVDVAKVALFLSSDEAAYVNGSGVAVDGGLIAQS
jgi:NAD(P)-dependent dehydrogenase (short-subunit alcohol dehydrogenase family)